MSELSLMYRNGMIVAQSCHDDDEDDGGPGRILTVEEFIERLRDRTDIFGIDRNRRIRNTEIVTLLVAIVVGVLATNAAKEAAKVNGGLFHYGPVNEGAAVTFHPEPIEPAKPAQPAVIDKPAVLNSDGRKALGPNRHAAITSARPSDGSGGGSIRSRIAKMGVLGTLASHVRGRDVDGEFMAKGGFAERIDVILSGMQGLKHGGMSSVSRKGAERIGFGPGFGPSGFDGTPAAGIDDMIEGLMRSQEPLSLTPPKTGPPRLLGTAEDVQPLSGGTILGTGRSKASILRVVMQNLAALRYAYNKRLREKPGLTGKITIKFAIDEFGSVVRCDVIESTLEDDDLENAVTGKISRWRFERVDKPGDITEVVYPFVFST